MAIKRQEKDRNKKKEKEYIRLFTEDIEMVLDQKKGLSKIDPISSFRSIVLRALDKFEMKNTKKHSVRALSGGATGLVQQKRKNDF